MASTTSSFDLVVSIFGAMFAPKPFDVAKEMVRVHAARRPHRDGQLDPERSDARRADPEDQRVVLAAAAGGLRQPDDLGRRGRTCIERFEAAGVPKEGISFERDTYTFNFAGTPAELVATFRDYYGPTMNAFEAAGGRPRGRPAGRAGEPCSRSRTRATTAPRFRRRSCG